MNRHQCFGGLPIPVLVQLEKTVKKAVASHREGVGRTQHIIRHSASFHDATSSSQQFPEHKNIDASRSRGHLSYCTYWIGYKRILGGWLSRALTTVVHRYRGQCQTYRAD